MNFKNYTLNISYYTSYQYKMRYAEQQRQNPRQIRRKHEYKKQSTRKKSKTNIMQCYTVEYDSCLQIFTEFS